MAPVLQAVCYRMHASIYSVSFGMAKHNNSTVSIHMCPELCTTRVQILFWKFEIVELGYVVNYIL